MTVGLLERWWTSRGRLNFFSEIFRRGSSLPLVSDACGTSRKLGLFVTLWWDWRFKCPKWWWGRLAPGWSAVERFLKILTGLPQVYWTLKDLLKSWLDCPRFTGQYHIKSPFVDGIFFAMGVSSPLKWFLFTERAFVPLNIHCVNFFAVKQIATCKQRYSNNAKFMLVSKFWKMRFLAENFL